TSRIDPTLSALRHDLLSPRQWLVAVPLAAVLAAAAALRTRRLLPLALALALLFAFLVWVYWADSQDLGYRLSTSGYRVVDTLTLLAAAASPVLAEALVRAGRGRSGGRRRRAEASGRASSAPG